MTEMNLPAEHAPKKSFSTVMNWITCILFTALLCVPLVLLGTTGEDKTVLDGEKQHEAPAFSVGDFVSAEFQGQFELWFSTKYPLRGKLVSTYRQLQFDTANIGFDITTLFLPKTPPKPVEPAPTPDSLENPDAVVEAESPYSDFNPMYAEINRRLYEREAIEGTGYKGNAQVVIGKSGYCYENAYIQELYGYVPEYRDCPDYWLEDRIEKMTYIQKRLGEMGIAFSLVISPSKAAQYERFIPDWYHTQYVAPEDYVRPVERLRAMLAESEINYLDTVAYFEEIGLDETFPLTGIHWNKPAGYEATRKLMHMYEEQTGEVARNVLATSLTEQKTPSGYGNPEQDIFGIAYSGLSTKDAIVDEFYYIPEVILENEEEGERLNIFLQGGSFAWDFTHYMKNTKISRRFFQYFYQTWQGTDTTNPLTNGDEAWEAILRNVDYVIFECNEQHVFQMGAAAPRWKGAEEGELLPGILDVYESLYDYLKRTENTAE